MKFPSPLISAVLLRRYRRFLIDARLQDGTVVTAHCPNSGTMLGCSEPGSEVMLLKSSAPNRKNALNWELINVHGTWVSINPLIGHKIAVDAITSGLLVSPSEFTEIQREATVGLRTQVDLLMHGMEHNTLVNIFTVTCAENNTALFPDSMNAKAEKRIRQLAEIAEQGHKAVAFFFVQRADCHALKPATDVHLAFRDAMLSAQNAGVQLLAYSAKVDPSGVAIGSSIPCVLD